MAEQAGKFKSWLGLHPRLRGAITAVMFLSVLYLFFLSIEMMGGAFKLLGADHAKNLLAVTDNPLVGLVLGILATSLVQSSSFTTSTVVMLVGAGSISVEQAVPVIMGANIGTTVTNTLVSMGHMRLRSEFELAFVGATVHDFFNLCAVAVLLPLEMLFQPIQRSAEFLTGQLLGMGGMKFESPLKAIVTPLSKLSEDLLGLISDNPTVVGILLAVLALGLLFFSLSRMVRIMRGALAEKLELIVDRYLFTSTTRALIIGLVITALVQSSSVTTSLVVPMIATGIVRIDAVYPFMLGANMGTTVTALMASLVTGSTGCVTVALCHFFFNAYGTAIFLPLRRIPIQLATWLGRATAKRRWIALAYVLVVFFGIPGLLVFLSS